MNVGFPVPDAVWAVSVVVGIIVTSVLFCSHFHQIEGDRAAGKLSPLVRLGASRALQVDLTPNVVAALCSRVTSLGQAGGVTLKAIGAV